MGRVRNRIESGKAVKAYRFVARRFRYKQLDERALLSEDIVEIFRTYLAQAVCSFKPKRGKYIKETYVDYEKELGYSRPKNNEQALEILEGIALYIDNFTPTDKQLNTFRSNLYKGMVRKQKRKIALRRFAGIAGLGVAAVGLAWGLPAIVAAARSGEIESLKAYLGMFVPTAGASAVGLTAALRTPLKTRLAKGELGQFVDACKRAYPDIENPQVI